MLASCCEAPDNDRVVQCCTSARLEALNSDARRWHADLMVCEMIGDSRYNDEAMNKVSML